MSHDFGHPTPASWLSEGTKLTYFERDEDGIERGPFVYTVPATLRLDEVGKRAAQKHMCESALGTTSRPLRREGRS